MLGCPAGKLPCRRTVNTKTTIKVMGDKSPKSNQKKSTQKQTKASSAEQKKQAAIATKQSPTKKK